MGAQPVGKLGSGQLVFDRPRSHVHASARAVLPEALAQLDLTTEPFVVKQIEFGRVIGAATCVATANDDDILFAQRPHRLGLTRFVQGRMPEPATTLVVILKQIEEGNYLLITAFVGKETPPEPWDSKATEQSVAFWNSHALVWGEEEIIPDSETLDCPW